METANFDCVLVCPLVGVKEEDLSRDIEEVARNIREMLKPDILRFEYFAAGSYCLDEQGRIYNGWFEVVASGERFPIAVLEAEQCRSEDFNLCVRPDWFDGSIRWIGPGHKMEFQSQLLAWCDRQFETRRSLQTLAVESPASASPDAAEAEPLAA
ncbi:MAG: hypothetical protein SFV17_12625 [Candidatus Obscuribacter sp.]|nr:hypothetical protein [Candidatus Melainabacteria bacterium]MDX1987525.1 hypothetical protein [Candidatus Obscuribacter sp.]